MLVLRPPNLLLCMSTARFSPLTPCEAAWYIMLPSQASGESRSLVFLHCATPPVPQPSLLFLPAVAPISYTFSTTAFVSRLFTKPWHITSTPAPSSPRHCV
ncbi:hypothetical protein C8Q74DRAFT_1270486, partial [Fomes fomentarius]